MLSQGWRPLAWKSYSLVIVREYDSLVVRVVPIAHDHFLADLGNAVLDAANADAANELVVVNRGDQHLEGSLGIALRRLDGVQQGIEQGDQVGAGHIGVQACGALTAAAEQHLFHPY